MDGFSCAPVIPRFWPAAAAGFPCSAAGRLPAAVTGLPCPGAAERVPAGAAGRPCPGAAGRLPAGAAGRPCPGAPGRAPAVRAWFARRSALGSLIPVWLLWVLYTAIIFFFFWGGGVAAFSPVSFSAGAVFGAAGLASAGFGANAFFTMPSCSSDSILIWLFTSIFFSLKNARISLFVLSNSFASSCTLFDILTSVIQFVFHGHSYS